MNLIIVNDEQFLVIKHKIPNDSFSLMNPLTIISMNADSLIGQGFIVVQ